MPQSKKEYVLILNVAAVLIICIYALSTCFSRLASLLYLSRSLCDSYDLVGILLKGCAVCIFTQIVHDICKDSGQTAVAGAVILAGRLTVVALTLPLIETVLKTAAAYIN